MDIERFLKKLRREGPSDFSIAQCRGMLFQILNKAAANDLIMKNPVQYADKMRKQTKKRKEAFTADEVRTLLRDLRKRIGLWKIILIQVAFTPKCIGQLGRIALV